jgi:RimJ/RimL family protein N-acetyltransferase
MNISTSRLDLIPFTGDFMRASLAHDLATAEQLLGAKLPTGWPDCPRLLELRLGQLDADPKVLPWLLRAMVLRESNIMVGHIGFHEAPGSEHLREISAGAAEFGYTVYPPFRRRGFAREASLALMDWARNLHDVSRFILSIEPANVPSQGLAKQLGFVRIGSQIDEIDGEEDILELRTAAASGEPTNAELPTLPSAAKTR